MDKSYHVRKNEDIEKIIKRKDTVGDSCFVVYKLINPVVAHLRFAISVPKKYGNAVERNLIRRRVREIVTHASLKDDFDYFIVVKPAAAGLNFAELSADLHKLFARAKII
ncbi:MAG: ribonuclease P protein component [Candidatus Izemoplasmatales bacterium]